MAIQDVYSIGVYDVWTENITIQYNAHVCIDT